jgi:hypothetical protein
VAAAKAAWCALIPDDVLGDMAIAGEGGQMTTTIVSHSEELVWIESEDELELAGAVIRPVGRAPRSVAAIWVHGATSRFYAPAHVQIGRELAKIGYLFVTGNNRGHHLGANLLRRGGLQLGGDQLLVHPGAELAGDRFGHAQSGLPW